MQSNPTQTYRPSMAHGKIPVTGNDRYMSCSVVYSTGHFLMFYPKVLSVPRPYINPNVPNTSFASCLKLVPPCDASRWLVTPRLAANRPPMSDNFSQAAAAGLSWVGLEVGRGGGLGALD